MQVRASLWFIFTLLFTAHAFAHSSEHVMGVVKNIDSTALVVTQENKDVSVQLSASTKFEKGDKPATASDVKPGLKVIVHAMKHAGTLHAELVKIAP